ncbi:hypothetical protein SAMN05216369_2655 [Marinobacter antarcticus]|uniref:Uncharacterized protein n=1 Tax=Marinobacter antarcticus TaxID=564117 RepID=A0A1M6U8A5_9GAMM|nr:hypothetical protein [Marinobacter antarcticus]SHK65298.1 hypothetical protein SAMN05216369_2655 [Marinobacter antarcticus]
MSFNFNHIFHAGLEDDEQISNSAGVYGFLFNPFQKSKLGLYSGVPISEQRASEAKRALIKKLNNYNSLKSSKTIEANLKLLSPAGANEGTFIGKAAIFTDTFFQPAEIEALTISEFMAYLEMASHATLLSQAIYCGMTIKQGLRDRYSQHKSNYESDKPGTFGGRLSNFSISWNDLIFVYTPIGVPSADSKSIKLLERQIITMFNPLLSIR